VADRSRAGYLRAMRGTLLLLALIATGCVGKGRYTEALDANAALGAERDALSAQLARVTLESERLATELDATNALLDATNRRLAESIARAGDLESDVARMAAALEAAERRKERADAALEEYRQLVARFQSLIDAGTLSVKVLDGRLVVELATDILFPAGSASLSSGGRRAISEVATVLAGIEGREFQVAGHTDNVPIGNERFPSNWHLGSARAIAVVDVLVAGGLGADRVSAASYADTKPASTNRTPEGRAENRRIEIVVVPDLSELPGYDELSAIAAGGEGEAGPPARVGAPPPE
jgi:chemotaxis protein MotB